ncbi:MAG: undecaprenyldiphospho-muramoylpentapeptide beta-N-acetylglucosaminyltransferase [Deltaproteobacteria bacterium]|jgi:UDP-N-acetylglucosamine--N-acetylmuramyl-(pentapeptide) pyrophosphoryl-undecaprenol N-acetylglucosamine transferase|nr:undecaprenyldiphospho-muramoylpentapeptide beta-N-acetylglucosaminyltransferase [Deltaproteobacteria bacterium]
MIDAKEHNIRLIITGGGTGGHLFPGIALAQAMMRTYQDCEVLYIGTERKVDRTALADLGFKVMTIKSRGIKGKSFAAKVKALLQQPFALFEAVRIIKGFRPDLVFGVGGYVTVPVILGARLLGIATCIHEQNSIPGLANRLLGHITHRIFVSLPGSEKYFPAVKTILSGNPVRRSILDSASKMGPRVYKEPLTLLILGGSQGARRLNSIVLDAAEKYLRDLTPKPNIIHQTGEHDETQVREKYAELGISARVEAFFSDMAGIYSQADLVISRAGATTLAELTVSHKPVLLVPYPFAADNHQEINGRYLVQAGGGLMFRQSDLDGEKLGREVKRLLTDTALLAEMAENSGKKAKPEATETIINSCMELLKGKLQENMGKILAF